MNSIKVIKIGGNVINDPVLLIKCMHGLAQIPGKKILVHGGGNIATSLAAKLGHEQTMIEGRRVTDAETLKIVTMVYAGLANKNIVALLQSNGVDALGLTGADGHTIRAHKRVSSIDYGFVGDIEEVNVEKISALLFIFDILVFAPITMDDEGQLLNTNADTVAQALAQALSKQATVDLIYTFEKSGVLENADDDESVISVLDVKKYAALKQEGKVFAGMIPKLDNAFSAVQNGVNSVYIGKADALKKVVEGVSGTQIVVGDA